MNYWYQFKFISFFVLNQTGKLEDFQAISSIVLSMMISIIGGAGPTGHQAEPLD